MKARGKRAKKPKSSRTNGPGPRPARPTVNRYGKSRADRGFIDHPHAVAFLKKYGFNHVFTKDQVVEILGAIFKINLQAESDRGYKVQASTLANRLNNAATHERMWLSATPFSLELRSDGQYETLPLTKALTWLNIAEKTKRKAERGLEKARRFLRGLPYHTDLTTAIGKILDAVHTFLEGFKKEVQVKGEILDDTLGPLFETLQTMPLKLTPPGAS